MQRVLTVCPHCSCGCGLYLLVERGEVIGVMPSAGHPISRGSLCVKGWTSFQHLRRPDRLDSPYIRLNGTLKRVGWEEALSYLVEHLIAVRSKLGGHAIGLLASGRASNEELFLLSRIASRGLETAAVRFDPALHTLNHIPSSLVEGSRAAKLDEIQDADLLVILGHGLAGHHPQVASRILKAIDQGTRAIAISPYRDLLAERAVLHLRVPPLEEVASSLTDGAEGPFGSVRPFMEEAKQPLLIYPLKSLPFEREAKLLRDLERLLALRWARVLLLFPRANSRGAFHWRMGAARPEAHGLKALMVVEEDPAAWDTAFREVVASLDFLVVQDLFLTETAELAHVVLPSAAFAEKAGTLTNTEGRQQTLRAAIPPPGEARPGWVIAAEMARRFGLADVGSTLEEIRQGIAAEQLHADAAVPAEKPAILPPVESPSLRHLPDRLGWMWRRDTILRHTDDWEREHQDQWLEIHPEDAKALGLRPGWKVRVAGEGGEFQAVFRASERASPGILVSPHDLIEGPVRLERAA
jgi:predicted molibdopterin-dependent oxidoreductase YjgC